MRLVVDTGVFSASLSARRRSFFDGLVKQLSGNQLWLAVQTVAELRFGALVAGWGAHANDLWIAASAIHIRAALVTADRVFDDVPGLTLSS